MSVVYAILIIAAYFVPTIVAWVRHVHNAGSVTVINVFLGWSLVGWVVALAMACRSQVPANSQTFNITATSGTVTPQ
jgi:hypothetical protein